MTWVLDRTYMTAWADVQCLILKFCKIHSVACRAITSRIWVNHTQLSKSNPTIHACCVQSNKLGDYPTDYGFYQLFVQRLKDAGNIKMDTT